MRSTLLIVFWCLATLARAGKAEDPRFSHEAEQAAESRRTLIQAEIKQLRDHPWAGDYIAYTGWDTFRLTIAPSSGFVYEWRSNTRCEDRNYGAVTWTNNRVLLSFTFDNIKEGKPKISPEWMVVPWGSRRYLVAIDHIVSFCNKINQGVEPLNFYTLMRKGDEQKKVTGLPTLPLPYRNYLLSNPIEAVVSAVGASSTRTGEGSNKWVFTDTPIALNVGTNQGLFPGMELFVTQPEDIVEYVRTSRAEANRSEAIMSQWGEKPGLPKPGWRLSTRIPWQSSKEETGPHLVLKELSPSAIVALIVLVLAAACYFLAPLRQRRKAPPSPDRNASIH